MKRRFEINEDGLFVDRHGYVLGRVTSITIESVGTMGRGSSLGELTSEPSADQRDKQQPPTPTDSTDIEEVWAHYVETMRPRDKALHPDERKIIREALKVATVDECKTAITGCRASDFHMGKNERGRKYNRISNILKGSSRRGRTTREQIDYFIDVALEHGSPSAVTSEGKVKIERLKDRVRRGIKVEESIRELRDNYGVVTKREEDPDRPGFTLATFEWGELA